MGYLGLDETVVKDENLFQRLFWPSDHAAETDYLGQQGFWICVGVAVLSLIVLVVRGEWISGLLTFAFFALGGIGVREHSVGAATLVALAFWMNQVSGAISGRFPGFLSLAAGCLLLANIRGTYVAARWKLRGDPEAFPERLKTTLKERFVDQMPMRVWPRARVGFFILAGIYMLLSIAGVMLLPRH